MPTRSRAAFGLVVAVSLALVLSTVTERDSAPARGTLPAATAGTAHLVRHLDFGAAPPLASLRAVASDGQRLPASSRMREARAVDFSSRRTWGIIIPFPPVLL